MKELSQEEIEARIKALARKDREADEKSVAEAGYSAEEIRNMTGDEIFYRAHQHRRGDQEHVVWP
jgi:hypothetical protein